MIHAVSIRFGLALQGLEGLNVISESAQHDFDLCQNEIGDADSPPGVRKKAVRKRSIDPAGAKKRFTDRKIAVRRHTERQQV